MPRAKNNPAPPPTPDSADPLADLREDGDRYPDDAPQEAQESPQEAQGASGGSDPLATLIGEACGRVSMCWDPTPEGVFQSEAASAIVEDLVEAVRPMLEVQATGVQEAVERWHADTVAMGFLHKGGRCGCHYIARVIGLES